MERLTNKREADAQRKDYESRIRSGYPRNIPEERFLRLAAYEDTGLSPQACAEAREAGKVLSSCDISFGRFAELLTAYKEGRLVELPVKPVLTPIISSMLYIIEDGDIYEDALYEAIVGMSESGKTNVVYTTLSDQMVFEQADIGKTVFLTREKAKKALEAMRKDETT